MNTGRPESTTRDAAAITATGRPAEAGHGGCQAVALEWSSPRRRRRGRPGAPRVTSPARSRRPGVPVARARERPGGRGGREEVDVGGRKVRGPELAASGRA